MTQPQKQDAAEEARTADRRMFVDGTDFAGAPIGALRADASVRRYFRVEKGGKTAVLMDARPPLENTAIFAQMREKFDRIGLTVPEIYAADHERGFVLMEDFGDERYFELVTSGKGDPAKLYSAAVDVLVHKFHADPAVALQDSVAYSDEYWLKRIDQFFQHYVPHVLPRGVGEEARAELLGLFSTALGDSHRFDPVLLHGDYGAQNIYDLPGREGVKKVGLIDFQDLTDARGNMMGSPAFDLVFLMQDVRMDLPQGLEDEMRARFIKGAGIKDEYDFNAAYATIGAAQAVKCLGLFARLGHGEKRAEYLDFIPYCWRNLAQNVRHPDLKDIREWFNKNDINIEKGLGS